MQKKLKNDSNILSKSNNKEDLNKAAKNNKSQ